MNKDRRDRSDRRNRGPRMDKKDFKALAKKDLVAARFAAVARDVPLAQIQLWELAL